jgi:hypothetical protein
LQLRTGLEPNVPDVINGFAADADLTQGAKNQGQADSSDNVET